MARTMNAAGADWTEPVVAAPDYDRVPEHDGCPHCGETRVDARIIDDDHVDCTTCGIGYWLYGVEVA